MRSKDQGRSWAHVSQIYTKGSRNGMPGAVIIPPASGGGGGSSARGNSTIVVVHEGFLRGMWGNYSVHSAGASAVAAGPSHLLPLSRSPSRSPSPSLSPPTVPSVSLFHPSHASRSPPSVSFDSGVTWQQRANVFVPVQGYNAGSPQVIGPFAAGTFASTLIVPVSSASHPIVL